jgi:hypothetical protein
MGNLATLGGRFAFNSNFLGVVTGDFSAPSDWGGREDSLNAAHWVLAHITGTRRITARLLGQEVAQDDWEQAVKMGGAPQGYQQAPEPEALRTEFVELGSLIERTLDSFGPEQLSQKIDGQFPDGSETVEQAAFGLYMHECIHLGQLLLIRRLLGKDRIV